jgi:hypothetical protein
MRGDALCSLVWVKGLSETCSYKSVNSRLVHCSAVGKCNLYSRCMFNLNQVSIKTSAYQNSSGNEKFKSMPWNLVAFFGLIGPRSIKSINQN